MTSSAPFTATIIAGHAPLDDAALAHARAVLPAPEAPVWLDPGRAADIHHQRDADPLDRLRQRELGQLVLRGEDRFGAAAHVGAVVAVADGAVEIAEMAGMGGDGLPARRDQTRHERAILLHADPPR